MKSEINPIVVIAIVVLVLGAVGFFLYRKTGGEEGTSKSMPMPKAAAEEMARMQQNRPGAPVPAPR